MFMETVLKQLYLVSYERNSVTPKFVYFICFFFYLHFNNCAVFLFIEIYNTPQKAYCYGIYFILVISYNSVVRSATREVTCGPLSFVLFLWPSKFCKTMFYSLKIVKCSDLLTLYTANAKSITDSDWFDDLLS